MSELQEVLADVSWQLPVLGQPPGCSTVRSASYIGPGRHLWCASLDLRKAFDRIEHRSLFEALHDQGVPQCYISLLSALYRSQTGQVQAGRKFPLQRGIKQDDVLSPALFNAGLELALAHSSTIVFKYWRRMKKEDTGMSHATSCQPALNSTPIADRWMQGLPHRGRND